MNNLDMTKYDMTTSKGRQKFIEETPSGIYTGTNADDEHVEVYVDQGCGMTVKTVHKEKPNWFECVYYDEDGWQEGVSYEPYK